MISRIKCAVLNYCNLRQHIFVVAGCEKRTRSEARGTAAAGTSAAARSAGTSHVAVGRHVAFAERIELVADGKHEVAGEIVDRYVVDIIRRRSAAYV